MIYVRECGHSDDTNQPRYRKERCWYCQPPVESLAKALARARTAERMERVRNAKIGFRAPGIES